MRQMYSKEFLQELIEMYGLGPLQECFLFTSGFENSNYYIKTPSGKYVLKIFEGADIASESIRFEVSVMEHSFRSGVKTPQIQKNKSGELTTAKGGKLCALMSFVEGENMEKRTISDTLAKEVGEETGKMDTAISVFKDGSLTRHNYEFDGKNFLILEEKTRHLPLRFDSAIFEGIFIRFREMKPMLDTLPAGIIHNDIVLHNLLVRDGHLRAIIDFSDMAFSPYIQNVAVAMAQLIFTYNWQPQQAKVFIDGYRNYHPLSTRELSLLFDLTLARYAACVIELHYWNVAYGEDKQRIEFVNDMYGFLTRFRSLGKENFDTLIQ